MAQDWAKSFYNSKAWQDTRDLIVQQQYNICNCCKDHSIDLVHHIIELTPGNIGDPTVALSLDNLEGLCYSCHTLKHMETDTYGSPRKPATVDGVAFNEYGQLVAVEKESDDDEEID